MASIKMHTVFSVCEMSQVCAAKCAFCASRRAFPSDAVPVGKPVSDAGMDTGGKELKAELQEGAQRGCLEFSPRKIVLMKNI